MQPQHDTQEATPANDAIERIDDAARDADDLNTGIDLEGIDELAVLDAGADAGELVELADDALDTHAESFGAAVSATAAKSNALELVQESQPERWDQVMLTPFDIEGQPALAEIDPARAGHTPAAPRPHASTPISQLPTARRRGFLNRVFGRETKPGSHG